MGDPATESLDQRTVTLVLHRRPDGGLRVHSPDLPGLALSHEDAALVMRDLGPAIHGLLTRGSQWPEWVAPSPQVEG